MTNDQIKNALNQDSQILKDRFIDAHIRLMNDFQLDWNRITGKLAEINKEESQQDKLNKSE